MVGEPETLEKTDSEATLVINVEFAPSLVAYKTFATKFCQTLEGSCKVERGVHQRGRERIKSGPPALWPNWTG